MGACCANGEFLGWPPQSVVWPVLRYFPPPHHEKRLHDAGLNCQSPMFNYQCQSLLSHCRPPKAHGLPTSLLALKLAPQLALLAALPASAVLLASLQLLLGSSVQAGCMTLKADADPRPLCSQNAL